MSLFLVGPKKEKEIAQVWLMTNLMELLADWQYLAAQTHSEQGVDLFSGGPETKSHLGFFFLPCSILSICILVLDFVDAGMPIYAITLLTTTILHQCLAPQGTEEMNF